MPNDAQDFSFSVGGGLSPEQLPARRRLERHALEHPHLRERAGRARTPPPRPSRPAGTRPAPPAATAARCPPSTSAPGENVTCTFTNQKRGSIVAVLDAAAERRPGLLVHGRRRALAHELQPRRRLRSRALRTPARSTTCRSAAATRSARPAVPAAWVTSERHLQRRQPGLEHQRRAGRGGDLHLHEPEARRDRGREGRHARRPAGLLLHGRRRAGARAASSSTTTPTARCRTRGRSRASRPAPATRSPRRCRAAGTRPRPPATTAARCRTSTSRPAEVVTCTFTNRKRGRIVVVEGRHAGRPAGLLLHGRRRPLARELPARRRRRRARSRTPAPSATSCRARGYSLVRDACPAAGTRPARPATTAARCRTSTSRPARPSPALREPQARAARGRQGRAARRPAGLRLHGRRRPVARPASSSTTTPTRRCRHTRTFTNVVPGSGYSLSETVPSRLGPAERDLQTTAARSRTSTLAAGETVTCTFTNRKRGQIVVVKDARPERPAGLLVHGRRRAVARRASPSTTTPTGRSSNTPHLHRRGARERLLARRDACRAAGTRPARPVTTAARSSNIDVVRRRDRHLHLHEPQARADRGRAGRRARTTPQDFSFTAGGGLSPASFSLDDDLDPALSNTPHVQRRAGRLRLLGRRDRAGRLGPRRAPPATTAARCRTSPCRPARRSPARSRTTSAARSWS